MQAILEDRSRVVHMCLGYVSTSHLLSTDRSVQCSLVGRPPQHSALCGLDISREERVGGMGMTMLCGS